MPADFGDWGNTAAGTRRTLEESCADLLCGHIRWAHGTMWWAATNLSTVTYTVGSCTVRSCGCREFRAAPPITDDEVIDLAEMLKPKGLTLKALGIDLGDITCTVMVTRYLSEGDVTNRCIKDQGHNGDHTW